MKALRIVVAFGLTLGLGLATTQAQTSTHKTKHKKTAVAKASVETQQEMHHSSATKEIKQDVFLDLGGFVLAQVGGGVGYERALKNHQSIYGEVLIGNIYSMVGLEAGWRFWIDNKQSLRGFYAGPVAGVEFGSWGYYGGESSSITNIIIGGEGGYQWILNNKIVLNVGPSLYYQHLQASASYLGYAYDFSDSGIHLGIKGAVGYAF